MKPRLASVFRNYSSFKEQFLLVGQNLFTLRDILDSVINSAASEFTSELWQGHVACRF